MTSSFDFIPEELKTLRQWVCWKIIIDSKTSKISKLPFNPNTGKCASSADPGTWGTYEQAVNCFSKSGGYKGIGFVFSKNDPYTGIDLDKCRDKVTEEIKPWAQNVISRFKSYTELSPSGTGVHIIAKGSLPGKGKKVGDIEMYDQGRYFTVTGEIL